MNTIFTGRNELGAIYQNNEPVLPTLLYAGHTWTLVRALLSRTNSGVKIKATYRSNGKEQKKRRKSR